MKHAGLRLNNIKVNIKVEASVRKNLSLKIVKYHYKMSVHLISNQATSTYNTTKRRNFCTKTTRSSLHNTLKTNRTKKIKQ
jgi:hypothetical protein